MDLPSQIRQAVISASLPPPSAAWLQNLVSARTPPPPVTSLIATAKARLLASDLTSSGLLDPSASFLPAGVGNVEVKESRLPRDVVLQVLDMENLSKSRWEQVEELEAIARGEKTQGREIVRLPTGSAEEQNEGDAPPEDRPRPGAGGVGIGAGSRNAMHKLVLQDCKGQKAFGLEVKRIDRFGVGRLNIGEKLVVKSGAVVARGVILLDPSNCVALGGKVEAWQKPWVDGQLERLREAAGASRE
jgi:RecQ-mediated genome instability protein 1